MANNFNITTNAGGIVYISNTGVNVGTENVNIALGFRRIPPIGYLTIRMSNAIPAGTTATLPVTLTLNGITRAMTLPNGNPVTVEELTGTNVFLVFNDKFSGYLYLMSRTVI